MQAAGLSGGSAIAPEDRVGYGIDQPSTVGLQGEWPAVGRVWGRVDPIGDHGLVQLFFAAARFFALWREDEGVPLEQDPLKPLAHAFGAAGAGLDAEVGWLDAMEHYGEEDWATRTGSRRLNTAWARRYLDAGVEAIVDERFPLTWMRNDVARDWVPDFTREFQTTDAGWLLWAGDASSRWTLTA